VATIKKREYQQRLPDGTIKTCTTAKYYGFVGGRYVALCENRQASETMLRDLKNRTEREGAGLIDARVLNAPIQLHIADYVAHLERTGRSEDYIRKPHARLKALAKSCEWQTIRSITLASLEKWIDDTKAELGDVTINHYLDAAKALCNWAVERGKLYANPLDKLSAIPIGKLEHERRALTEDEIRRLLNVADQGRLPRRLIYWTALVTGLRRAELKELQWGDLKIDNVTAPYIQLRASTTKSRRADVLPLRGDIAEALRRLRPDGWREADRVFRRIPTSTTVKKDMVVAGIPDVDQHGRHADLHCLRHSYCSHLAAAGVNPRAAMGLMRHTDMRLTASVYTDENLLPLREAVEALPSFAPTEPVIQPAEVAATGTDGKIEKPRSTDTRVPMSGVGNFLRSSGDTGRTIRHSLTQATATDGRINAVSGVKYMREGGLEPPRFPTGS